MDFNVIKVHIAPYLGQVRTWFALFFFIGGKELEDMIDLKGKEKTPLVSFDSPTNVVLENHLKIMVEAKNTESMMYKLCLLSRPNIGGYSLDMVLETSTFVHHHTISFLQFFQCSRTSHYLSITGPAAVSTADKIYKSTRTYTN